MTEKLPRRILLIIVAVAIAALIVINFGSVMSVIATLWHILLPLLFGIGIAYIIDIIRAPLSTLILPKASKKATLKLKHGLLIGIIFILLVAFVILTVYLVIPSLKNTVSVLISSIPSVVNWVRSQSGWIDNYSSELAEWVANFDFSAQEIVPLVESYIQSGAGGLISSAFSAIGSTFNVLYSALIASIFSLYVIYNKNKLKEQIKRLIRLYLPAPHNGRLLTVLRCANGCFRSYLISQGLQALIMTVLSITGLLAFGFPEPVMIGIFVGVTVLIPLIGSFIGPAVGFLIVLAMRPGSALWFLVFIVLLEQLVGNVIYPKLAGKTVGLPGMWVFFSVVVGGSLFGIMGLILGVPVMATCYQLLRKDAMEKEKQLLTASATPHKAP